VLHDHLIRLSVVILHCLSCWFQESSSLCRC